MRDDTLWTHVVPDDVGHAHLDKYLAARCPLFPSKAGAHKAVRRGEVHIDGATTDPGALVRPGMRIDVVPPTRPAPPALALTIPVVWEDDAVAVVDKPPGLVVMGARARTLERALRGNLTPSSAADALPWPRPVHRLDGATGGLVVCAKTRRAQVALGHQFEDREVGKRYRAVVLGRLDGEGVVDTPLGGRDARTRWAAARHARCLRTEWLTLVDLWPETGRTHQLRRHLHGLGHPILGDALYTAGESLVLRRRGLFLWAVEVTFAHPDTGVATPVSIGTPPKFDTTLAREERRWRRHHGDG